LVEGIKPFEGGQNDIGHILDRFGDAFAQIALGIAIA
jgi:hypothetical protein